MDEYIKKLEKNDDPVRWECPEVLDYVTEQNDFFSTKDRSQSILHTKLNFETDSAIQDASYHSCISLPVESSKNKDAYANIRFSNFGKLVSFVDEDDIKESVVKDIVQHLLNIRCIYILSKFSKLNVRVKIKKNIRCLYMVSTIF